MRTDLPRAQSLPPKPLRGPPARHRPAPGKFFLAPRAGPSPPRSRLVATRPRPGPRPKPRAPRPPPPPPTRRLRGHRSLRGGSIAGGGRRRTRRSRKRGRPGRRRRPSSGPFASGPCASGPCAMDGGPRTRSPTSWQTSSTSGTQSGVRPTTVLPTTYPLPEGKRGVQLRPPPGLGLRTGGVRGWRRARPRRGRGGEGTPQYTGH